MDHDDLYAVLGVARTASDDELRKAYRRLAKKHHPDLNPGDAGAEARFKEISGAFEVLGKPEKRALYDELGADAEKIGYDPEKAEEYRQWKRRSEAAASYGGWAPFEGQGGDGSHGDLEDLIGELFARQGRGGPRRGADAQASLRVSFRDAALGAKTEIELPKAGQAASTRIALTIPPGVEDGQRLRVAGHGGPGRDGGPAGDLFVRLEVAPHPCFKREGLDLAVDVPITVPEALIGARVEVPTLGSAVRVKVPLGARSGQKLRLRGKGIAAAGAEPGDLLVTLVVALPDGGDEATRARLAEELAALYTRDVRTELQQEASR